MRKIICDVPSGIYFVPPVNQLNVYEVCKMYLKKNWFGTRVL
jgi:hypothetical protein